MERLERQNDLLQKKTIKVDMKIAKLQTRKEAIQQYYEAVQDHINRLTKAVVMSNELGGESEDVQQANEKKEEIGTTIIDITTAITEVPTVCKSNDDEDGHIESQSVEKQKNCNSKRRQKNEKAAVRNRMKRLSLVRCEIRQTN